MEKDTRWVGGGDGGRGEQSVAYARGGPGPPNLSVGALKGDLTDYLSGSLRVCKQVQSDQPLALILSASEIRHTHIHKHCNYT